MLSVCFALVMVMFTCCENVSFGSGVIPRIFGCFVVGSVCLFNLSDRVMPYSVGSGVKSVVVFLSVHTTITSQYLSSRKNNKVTNTTPYDIHLSEQTLPRHMCTKLAQLRANIQCTLILTRHNPHYACHTYTTLITSLTIVKYQHNTTSLVCRKSL